MERNTKEPAPDLILANTPSQNISVIKPMMQKRKAPNYTVAFSHPPHNDIKK
jgi:hypothetical protein